MIGQRETELSEVVPLGPCRQDQPEGDEGLTRSILQGYYDLAKLFAGSYGTLGLIATVAVRFVFPAVSGEGPAFCRPITVRSAEM